MLTKSHYLDFRAAVEAGNAFPVAGFTNLTIQILNAGTGVAMTVEGSCEDGETLALNPKTPPTIWSPITFYVTADGLALIDILPNIAWIRLNTTAFGSGTPRAVLRYSAQ